MTPGQHRSEEKTTQEASKVKNESTHEQPSSSIHNSLLQSPLSRNRSKGDQGKEISYFEVRTQKEKD